MTISIIFSGLLQVHVPCFDLGVPFGAVGTFDSQNLDSQNLDSQNLDSQNLFAWDISAADGAVVLTLQGEVDISVAPAFAEAFDRGLTQATTSLIADLADLEYIDSSGLKVLVSTLRTCDTTGVPFRVVNMRSPVRRVFDIAGLLDVLCPDGVSNPPNGE